MTNLYVKNSMKKKAASALGEMEKIISIKNRVAYSSLISLHTSLENKDEVFWIWKKMKSMYRKLSDSEYLCMIASLLKLTEFNEAEKLYREWMSVSPTGNTRVPNLLIAAYINKNQTDMAERIYNEMVEKGLSPSYMTWLFLTQGYVKEKQCEKALDSFKEAISSVKKWDPDEKLLRQIFGILEEQGDVDGAESLLVALRRAGHVTTSIYNSLLQTYATAGKMPLIVAERMKKDNVPLDEETNRLIKLTSKMCVTEIPSSMC